MDMEAWRGVVHGVAKSWTQLSDRTELNSFNVYVVSTALHISPFVIQSLSCVQPFGSPWTAARQASLSFTISRSLLKVMPIELVMLSNHLILCCPLLLLFSIFPSTGSFPMSWLFTSGGQSLGTWHDPCQVVYHSARTAVSKYHKLDGLEKHTHTHTDTHTHTSGLTALEARSLRSRG